MYRVCIALIDATRARLFSFERVSGQASIREEQALDDQRDQHVSQLDDQFARMAMAALRELIDEHPTQRAVICASPRMLGRLRAAAPGLLPGDIALDEIPRDLVKLSPGQVRAELASRGLLSQV